MVSLIKNTYNPIAEQSRQWLLEALLSLMKEKPYQDITITEIADRADLSRRTFYRNFTSKEDILLTHFKLIYNDYINDLSKKDSLYLPDITQVFFSFWCRHLDFLTLLKKSNLYFMLLETMNDLIPEVYTMFKGTDDGYDSEEARKYALFFSVGGFWNMLSLWLDDDAPKTPEQLAEIITHSLRYSYDDISSVR